MSEALEALTRRPVTRRGLLRSAGAAVLGVSTATVLGACGESGSPTGLQSPVDSTTSAAPGETAAVRPTQTISAEATADAREVPKVTGPELAVEWLTVRNAALAEEIRQEGEDLRGDSAARDTDDPTHWSQAAVLAVPAREVENEDVLNIAAVVPDAGQDDGPLVRYARIDKGALKPWRVRDVDGTEIDGLALRVRIGQDPSTVSFVSGEINNQPPGSSWAAESTRFVDYTTVADARYGAAPLA
jgi:hypothetical protein